MNGQYEVLNPWAEVDPKPVRGINPRLTDLEGKIIGLFRNDKRTALPMADAIEARLKKRFPTMQFTSFLRPENLAVTEVNKEKFEEWAAGLDGAIFLTGD
jgi:hypothetical protein